MPAAIEGTYKDRDIEGLLDIYFYRRVGFALARFFARLGMTPTGVTLLSAISGLAAGHLYYYRDLRLNLLGMGLHIVSNAFDNADGQLARLTNRGSRAGRILDSVSDHIVFLGIYLHLVLRCLAAGASQAVWLLALAAGLSHAVQGGFAPGILPVQVQTLRQSNLHTLERARFVTMRIFIAVPHARRE